MKIPSNEDGFEIKRGHKSKSSRRTPKWRSGTPIIGQFNRENIDKNKRTPFKSTPVTYIPKINLDKTDLAIISDKLRTILNNVWYYKIEVIVKSQKIFAEIFNSTSHFNFDGAEDEKNNLFIYRLKLIQEIMNSIQNQTEISNEFYEQLDIADKIRSFYLLKNNWDNDGAKGISKNIIDIALRLLRNNPNSVPCFTYPTFDGKIGIDFKKGNKRLEVKILSKDLIDCHVIENKRTLIYDEQSSFSNFENVYKVIK